VASSGGIKFNQSAGNIEVGSVEPKDAGTIPVRVKAELKDYPGVTASYGFTAFMVGKCANYKLVPAGNSTPFTDVGYSLNGPEIL
jgi:hypothetical protein